MVLMTFSQLVDFTYQISQPSGNELQQLSNSIGFLTITQHSMELRLMHPTSGTNEVRVLLNLETLPKHSAAFVPSRWNVQHPRPQKSCPRIPTCPVACNQTL